MPIVLALLALFVAAALSFGNALWADEPEDTGVLIATNAGYIGHDEIEAAKIKADILIESLATTALQGRGVRAPAPAVAPPIVLDEATALKLRQYAMPNKVDWSDKPVPDGTDGYHIERQVMMASIYREGNTETATTQWHVVVNNTGNTNTTFADADVVIGLTYVYQISPLRNGEFIPTLAGNPNQDKVSVSSHSAKRVYAVSNSRATPGEGPGVPIIAVLWDIPDEPSDSSVGAISYTVQRRSLTDSDIHWTDLDLNQQIVEDGILSIDSRSDLSTSIEWNKIYEYRVVKMAGTEEVVTTESVFAETGIPLRPQHAVNILLADTEPNTAAQNPHGDWDAIFYDFSITAFDGEIDRNLIAAYLVYQRVNPSAHPNIPGVSDEYEVVAIISDDSDVFWRHTSRRDYDVYFVPITSHRQTGPRSEFYLVHATRSESDSLAQLAALNVKVNRSAAVESVRPTEWPRTVNYTLPYGGTTHHRVWANPATLRTITVEPIPRAIGLSADNPADVQVMSSVDVIYNGLMNLDTGGAYAAGELIGNGVFDITVPQEFADALADQSGFDEVPTDYLEIEIVVNSVDRSYTRTIKIAVGCWSDTSNFDLIRAATASAESVPSSSECEPDDVLSPNDHRYQHFLGAVAP